MRKIIFKNKNKGFVILFAVTIASILLAIALGLGNINLKEVAFSTSARNSNDSFFAADTGAECALFNDKSTSGIFTSTSTATQITCNGNTINLTKSGSLPDLSWSFVVTGLGNSGNACATVTIAKDFSNSNAQIDSKGYNIGDSNCDSTNPARTEREIEINYSF